MTSILETAFQRAARLPESAQEAIARDIITRIEQEERQDASLVVETVDALRAFRKNLTLGDITVRDLIDEGRI